MTKSVKQLYTQFKPNHYDLHLTLHPDEMTFSGKVTIKGLKVGRPMERMTFHQKALKFTGASITKHGKNADEIINVQRINLHNSFDEVRLHTETTLYPGEYTVTMEFSGNITKQMNGLYPCYFEKDGTQQKLLATQFESHHAREVFPCIDEPAAKATFDLSLSAPEAKAVLANTPVKTTSVANRLQTTVFETTPVMSTYLLAFVWGELDYLEATTKDGVLIRTYATPEHVKSTQFALDISVKILEFYNDYFHISYPLPKCDMIALPDFASGAMENWGCVTFREQALLVDEKNSTLSNKQWVAMVVAHELAHQWFGNLVTMRWWTDLWLNEGFASWIEFLAVDHIFPEWNMWTQFATNDQQQALKLDALEYTHPIEVAVNHPDEIRSIFDAISYSKGASVIHMLNQYLGADVFRDGLRFYLDKHKYSNTNTVDLWESLEQVSGKPVKSFMHAWTSLPGYPLLDTTVTDASVTIEQSRFLLNPLHSSIEQTIWPVPLLADGLPDQLSTASQSFAMPDTNKVLLNKGQSGFYRVAYNASHLKHIGEQIKAGRLDVLDRLGVLSDVFETARAGKTDTADALHFLENYRNETDYAVWDIITTSLGNLRMVMGTNEIRELMKPYIRELISTELDRLGWETSANDSHFDKLLRPIILSLAAISDDPAILKHCRKLFDNMSSPEDIHSELRESSTTSEVKRGMDIDPDMRGVVYGTIARTGDESDFEKMLKMHNNSNLSEERTTLAAALTGFKQPKLIKRALSLIDSDTVRLQDVAYWIAYSFLNRHARTLTWDWLKEHWSWLEKNLGSDLSFYRTPIYVARVQIDKRFISEYTAFFEPKLSPALDRSYRQGLEILQWQSDWRERDQKEVIKYFSSFAEATD